MYQTKEPTCALTRRVEVPKLGKQLGEVWVYCPGDGDGAAVGREPCFCELRRQDAWSVAFVGLEHDVDAVLVEGRPEVVVRQPHAARPCASNRVNRSLSHALQGNG